MRTTRTTFIVKCNLRSKTLKNRPDLVRTNSGKPLRSAPCLSDRGNEELLVLRL
jgi:hypothetical protein